MTKEETKILEKEIFVKFLNTHIGKAWNSEYKIESSNPSESPDFLCKTNDNKTIGLEITRFFIEHKNLPYSRSLTRIGNNICKLAKKEFNLDISIIIDKYDKRIWSAKWADHIDYAYNPGFEKIPNEKIFKIALEKILNENIENIKRSGLVKKWFQVNDEYYQASICSVFRSQITGKYDCHVNNTGAIIYNPFSELQKCIDNKNDKIKKYGKNLDKLFLLIFVPDYNVGNYCEFTTDIFEHRFISDYDSVFLYCDNKKTAFKLNLNHL